MSSTSDHAKLPPSSSDKWLVCWGWYEATKDIPDDSSVFAEEGTEAHAVLEASLRLGLDPSEVTDDAEVIEPVAAVIGWLNLFMSENPGVHLQIEELVQWGPQDWMTGHADLILVSDEFLGIVDYKHGKGIKVDPEDNSQLNLYLNGAYRKYGPRPKMFVGVGQPRITQSDPVRTVPFTSTQLLVFNRRIKYAVQANLSGGERRAGEHCRHFCKAAGTCGTFATYCMDIARREFDP